MGAGPRPRPAKRSGPMAGGLACDPDPEISRDLPLPEWNAQSPDPLAQATPDETQSSPVESSGRLSLRLLLCCTDRVLHNESAKDGAQLEAPGWGSGEGPPLIRPAPSAETNRSSLARPGLLRQKPRARGPERALPRGLHLWLAHLAHSTRLSAGYRTRRHILRREEAACAEPAREVLLQLGFCEARRARGEGAAHMLSFVRPREAACQRTDATQHRGRRWKSRPAGEA